MNGKRVGIDLGGTSIRAAVAGDGGKHGPIVHRPTPAADGPDAVLEACAQAAREAASGDLERVAIGFPGGVDSARGIAFGATHLPGFEGVDIGKLLSKRAGCPVDLENDANLAGYAEWSFGAGRNTSPFLFMTVSTGIGGGIIIDGAPYHGFAGTAGEIGHVPSAPDGPSCGSGHPGCLEAVGSGTGIANRAREIIAGDEPTALRDVAAQEVTAAVVADAARNGDLVAKRLFDEAGRAVGRSIGGLINVLSPERVVVGGGLTATGDLLFLPLRAGVIEMALPESARRCSIHPAELGTDAGLVGATAWAMRG